MSDNSSSGAADPNAQRLATSEGSAPLRAVDLDDDSLSANQGRDSRNSSRASAAESDTARGGRPTLEQLLVTPVQDYLASLGRAQIRWQSNSAKVTSNFGRNAFGLGRSALCTGAGAGGAG